MTEKGDTATLFLGEQVDYPSQPGSTIINGGFPILGPYSRVQKQRLGGPVRKSDKVAAAVGCGDKVTDKYRSDGLVTINDI